MIEYTIRCDNYTKALPDGSIHHAIAPVVMSLAGLRVRACKKAITTCTYKNELNKKNNNRTLIVISVGGPVPLDTLMSGVMES
jgi:hypothetical protein